MAEADRDAIQQAARHLLQQPLTCAERHPEQFRVIRRHEQTLDRWFTQRLGYRKWMIRMGLARELHEHIDRYETDDSADAILEIDPDRVALLPLPILGRAQTPDALLDRDDRRASVRQWLRARLVEEPVLYRGDLSDHEWTELRRRIGEETALLDEMFALRVESRGEGVAAIDPNGQLSDRPFPGTGTLSHAALMLIDWMSGRPGSRCAMVEVRLAFDEIVEAHKRHWSKVKLENVSGLLNEVIELLADLKLAEKHDDALELKPAAVRYSVCATQVDADSHVDAANTGTTLGNRRAGTARKPVNGAADANDTDRQGTLW